MKISVLEVVPDVNCIGGSPALVEQRRKHWWIWQCDVAAQISASALSEAHRNAELPGAHQCDLNHPPPEKHSFFLIALKVVQANGGVEVVERKQHPSWRSAWDEVDHFSQVC